MSGEQDESGTDCETLCTAGNNEVTQVRIAAAVTISVTRVVGCC
jgi:hypothetical protein